MRYGVINLGRWLDPATLCTLRAERVLREKYTPCSLPAFRIDPSVRGFPVPMVILIYQSLMIETVELPRGDQLIARGNLQLVIGRVGTWFLNNSHALKKLLIRGSQKRNPPHPTVCITDFCLLHDPYPRVDDRINIGSIAVNRMTGEKVCHKVTSNSDR